MKTLLFLSTIIFVSFINTAIAQTFANVTACGRDGHNVIESLRDARYKFNKELIKSKVLKLNMLPKSEYIFHKPGEHTILFDGVNFVIKENNVVSINGISASKEILSIISEKLLILDSLQYFYSEKSNEKYLNPNRNLAVIYNADRQFFATLRILNTTVKDIALLAKKKTSRLTFELSLLKMPSPNISPAILAEKI